MGKFKVGDHLKAIRYFDSIINKTLIDAEVTDEARPIDGSILSGKMRIKYIRFLNGDIKETGKSFWVDPQYFDYADGYSPVSGTVASFMINGQEYTNEQYEKDCKRFLETFPDEKSFDLSYAMENILNVYQWAQRNPVVTNLDHCAEEFGWKEEQKKLVLEHICPFPFMGNWHDGCPRDATNNRIPCGECRDWWNQEWKGAECTIQ